MGVILCGLMPNDGFQQDLFSLSPKEQKKREIIMKIVDSANQKYGRKVLKLGAEGVGESQVTCREKELKHFTTRWNDLLTIRLNP